MPNPDSDIDPEVADPIEDPDEDDAQQSGSNGQKRSRDETADSRPISPRQKKATGPQDPDDASDDTAPTTEKEDSDDASPNVQTATIEDMRALQRAVAQLAKAQQWQMERSFAGQATTPAQEKTRFEKFTIEKRRMLLAATYNSDPSVPATSLRPAYLQVINSSKEQALESFRHLIAGIPAETGGRMYSGARDQGIAMLARSAKFLPADDQETCLSVFLTAPYHIMCGFAAKRAGLSEEEWELSFQDNSSASLDRVKELLKTKIHACTELHDGIRQLQNWRLLLAACFGAKSAAASTVQKIVARLEKDEMFLAEIAHSNPNMMPGLFQTIYNLFRSFFDECSECTSDQVPPSINISLLWEQLKQGHNFITVPLPLTIRTALEQGPSKKNGDDRTREDKAESQTKRAEKQSRTKKKKGGDPNKAISDPNHPGFNRSFDRRLRIDDSQLRTALRNQDTLPKFNGSDKDICVNFHLRGGCRRGTECPSADSHNKLNDDTARQLKEWHQSTLA
jgi:hypothetical protein